MSTKNSELLSFVEKSNSTCKSRASKISIKVVLVSIFGTMHVYDDVTKGHTQAVFLVPRWCKTLKLEQTLTVLILCLGDPVTVCRLCLLPCLEQIVSSQAITQVLFAYIGIKKTRAVVPKSKEPSWCPCTTPDTLALLRQSCQIFNSWTPHSLLLPLPAGSEKAE